MNELLWWFGQNTLAALMMISCVILACRLFRDRPAVQHLLWLVILVKIVTPPIVVWPWSVDDLRNLAWTPTTTVQIAALEPLPVTASDKVKASYEPTEEPPLVPITTMPNLQPNTNSAVVPITNEPIANSAQPRPPIQWSSVFGYVLISIWFAGAIVSLASHLRRLVRFAGLIHSGADAPSHLKSEVTNVAALLRMKPPVSVVVKGFASPFLWCVGAARLAWPESISSLEDVRRSRGIIAHELAHMRRRDHWITWLELGASILWWWNPLFWYVRRQLRETAEMACDALAIATYPGSRHAYAELLLKLSSQSTNSGPAPVLAVGAGNVASFERRLKMILSSNVSGKLSWRGALTMTFLAVISLPCWSLAQTGPPDNANPNRVAEDQIAKEVQATPKDENVPRSEVPASHRLDVRVVDAATDKPASSVYLTLWRALSPDEPKLANSDGPTGFGYYNPVIWDDKQNNTRWIRIRSAHPNDGKHSKFTEQFTFKNLQAGQYRITAVTYQPQERSPDPTPYGVTEPIEVNGTAPTTVEIKLLSGDANATVKLIDAETRLPISAAAIRLRDSHGMPIVHGNGSGNFFERTDNDGTVQFRKLRPGSYSVEVLGKQASVNSFVEYAPVEEWTSFTAATGSNTTEIAVTPRALSDDEVAKRFPFSVYGRVTDEQGHPLGDVEIRAATGMGTLRGGGTVRSDADGNYRLYFGAGMMTQISEDAPLGVGLQAAHFYADGGNRKVVGQEDGYYSLLMSDRTKEQLLDEIKKEGQVWGRKDTVDVIFAKQPRQLDFVLSEQLDTAGETDDAADTSVSSSERNRFVPVKPKRIDFASSGSAEILEDGSVQLNDSGNWQEFTLWFAPANLPTAIQTMRLEILPPASSLPKSDKTVMLSDVKPWLKHKSGKTTSLEFVSCKYTGDAEDESTANCIDWLSDTGWKVPAFSGPESAHQLVLKFAEPIALDEGNVFGITIDADGSPDLGRLSRVRVSFVGLADPSKVDPTQADIKQGPQLVELPDEKYTKSGTHCQKIDDENPKSWSGILMGPMTWSDHEEGPLQIGMRVAKDAQWKIGGSVTVQLWVRNLSHNDVKFAQSGRSDNGLIVWVTDKDGREYRAEIAQFDGLLVFNHLLLPAFHGVLLKEFSVRLDAARDEVSKPFVAALQLAPGDYSLHCQWSDAHERSSHAGEWTGELKTGGHKFTLVGMNSRNDGSREIGNKSVNESAARNSLPPSIETLLDWGTPVDGLRGALMIQTSVQKPELANRPKILLVLQNVSDKPIRFCDTQMVKNDDVQVREDKRTLYLRDEEGILSGLSSSGGTDTDVWLQPREVVMIDLFYGEKPNERELSISSAMVETIVHDPSLTYSVTMNLTTAPSGAWSGKLSTPPSRGAAFANGSLPKNAEAQSLFRYCIDHARLNGDIPGGTISLLRAKVEYFIEINTADQSGDPYAKKMQPIMARLGKSGDWSQADVATLFDDIAAITTIPLNTTLDAIREHTLQRGMPLPTSLQNANWGAALAGGLRMAWMLEPRSDQVHLGSSLKSRIVIHNSGKEPVAFVTRNFHQPTHTAQNTNGAAVKLESTYWTTIGRPEPYRLHPGEYCEVAAPGIGIGPRNREVEDWANVRPGTWILADEGDEIQLQLGEVWLTGDHNQTIDADWWLKFVTERVDRESPLPAGQDERKLILFRVVQDLFGTSPQTTEADAFYADQSPEALHNLALLLSKRSWLTPVTGSIESGPTKIKVLPADPNAATRPRIVTTPGRYNVGDELRLEVTRVAIGGNILNEVRLTWYPQGKDSVATSISVPTGPNTWSAGWLPGTSIVWVATNDSLRSYDCANPASIQVKTFDAGQQTTAPISSELRAQLTDAIVTSENPKPVIGPPAATSVDSE